MATLDENQFDEMTTLDMVQDVENKMDNLELEKMEILGFLIKLRFTQGIDFKSYQNISLFFKEILDETDNEEKIIHKLYAFLDEQAEKIGYDLIGDSRMFLEYMNLLTYLDDVEKARDEEYFGYVERIGQLVRTNSINHTLLPVHRNQIKLDNNKTKELINQIPGTKK